MQIITLKVICEQSTTYERLKNHWTSKISVVSFLCYLACGWLIHYCCLSWSATMNVKAIKTFNEAFLTSIPHCLAKVTRCALGRTAQSRCSFQHLPKRNNLYDRAHVKRQLHKHDPLTTEIAINRSQALTNNVNVGRGFTNFSKAICRIFRQQHCINVQIPDPSNEVATKRNYFSSILWRKSKCKRLSNKNRLVFVCSARV